MQLNLVLLCSIPYPMVIRRRDVLMHGDPDPENCDDDLARCSSIDDAEGGLSIEDTTMAGRRFSLFPALLLSSLSISQLAGAACTPTRSGVPNAAEMHEAEVMYLPTPQPVVDAMLRLAGVTRGDVVYDLGSGDGRIPISAARDYGARGVGIELDGRMLERARCNAREAGMDPLVEFRQQDLFLAELRDATVVTLFLLPEMNRRLLPKLRAELRPGTRIVSHRFGLGDWAPERTIDADRHPLLLWTVP